jgi:hypothetical protein
LIGDVIGEFEGKVTGTRVIADHKYEGTDYGTCKILGINATFFDTVILTALPDEIYIVKAKSVITTEQKESIIGNFNGMAWGTGKGYEGKYKGVTYWKTSAQRFMPLTKILTMFDAEQDQEGNWTAKLYEIK